MKRWERIPEFRSRNEYDSFTQRLADELESPAAEEVPVTKPYGGGLGFSERWVRDSVTGEVWRLVEPDAPFRGLFSAGRRTRSVLASRLVVADPAPRR